MEPNLYILIVEDSETQALQLQYRLEQDNWEVLRVPNAESALEELKQRQPALIIAEHHLPGMRGDQLAERLRLDTRTRDIPVLILTTEDPQNAASSGYGAAADYISKSASSDILLARIHSLVPRLLVAPLVPASELLPSPVSRVLAIDDSPTYLELLADGLYEEGYRVTAASCGKDGLEHIANQAFDCVIVDLVMPEIDGIEVCRRLRNDLTRSENQSVAVIILTSSETQEDMTRGLEAGADDFVGKTSDMVVLKARIRALLRRKFILEENRRFREELLHKELEAAEERAAREIAETRAVLVDELQRKNKELEAFSYSVSHDLRAPLRRIDGFSAALLRNHADQLDAKAQDYLVRVREAATRMGQLIEDLLQLSRIGRTELQRRAVDLSTVARNVAGELQRANPERGVELRIADRAMADADPRLLQIVLENLLGNAWKFSSANPNPVIEFGVVESSDPAIYFVRDNGAGFDMEYAERLFTPFQRLHTDAQFPGTGIGLATVHRILERHGGRVWAESAVGKGAAFFWILPPQKGEKALEFQAASAGR